MPAVKITQKPIGTPGDDTHFLVTQPELPEGYTPTGQETEEELAELKVESVREIEMDDMVELIQDKLDMDATPTEDSTKPITSGGVKAALDEMDEGISSLNEDITNLQTNKQDALTFDQTPTAESTNPVTSVGIKNAIEAAVDITAPGIYETASGSIASFSDGADNLPMKSAVVSIEPIQEGTGDPSPENVRPISGRTGLSVVRCGKNMLPSTIHDIAPGSGLIIQNSDYRSLYAYIPCGGTYTVSRDSISGNRFRIYGLYNDPVPGPAQILNLNILQDDVLSKTFIVPDGIKVILVYLANNGSEITSKFQLELGSTATDYEPYKGNTYSVNWETEAGTVYGGTLDVVSGKLTVDRAYIASYNGETLPSTWISDRDVYAEGTTPTTGAQVVYKLADPVEYQLTPQEITTLLGTNNIWSDAGSIAVEYPADTKMYIDQKITEAIAAAMA
jgi:hypothetical protein